MKCLCPTLPDAFYVEDGPKGFIEALAEKDYSSENWKRLYECPTCPTMWVVDEWDKYGHQVASRLRERGRWDEESEEERKSLLLKSRGGITTEECAWMGCAKKKVRGVAYCIDHLYATGARK
jgi:hypothetical protein